MVLSGLIVALIWIFAFWQWAMMFTDGFLERQKQRGEPLGLLIVVCRSGLVLLLCLGSLLVPEWLGLLP